MHKRPLLFEYADCAINLPVPITTDQVTAKDNPRNHLKSGGCQHMAMTANTEAFSATEN
jgi:hypothetical protein